MGYWSNPFHCFMWVVSNNIFKMNVTGSGAIVGIQSVQNTVFIGFAIIGVIVIVMVVWWILVPK